MHMDQTEKIPIVKPTMTANDIRLKGIAQSIQHSIASGAKVTIMFFSLVLRVKNIQASGGVFYLEVYQLYPNETRWIIQDTTAGIAIFPVEVFNLER